MADQPLVTLRPSDERGQALVETAIVLPIYLLIIFGVFFFGETYDEKITVTQAARFATMLYADGKAKAEVSDILAQTYYRHHGPEDFSLSDNLGAEGINYDASQFQKITAETLKALNDVLAGLGLQSYDSASVEFGYHNPFSGSKIVPFEKEGYAISSGFIIAGNPWAYEEVGDIDWVNLVEGVASGFVSGLLDLLESLGM